MSDHRPAFTPWHLRALDALAQLSEHQAYVTSDDLYEAVGSPPVPNMVGSVFGDSEFRRHYRFTNRFVPSRRGPAKGRFIRLWESRHCSPSEDPEAAYEALRGGQMRLTLD